MAYEISMISPGTALIVVMTYARVCQLANGQLQGLPVGYSATQYIGCFEEYHIPGWRLGVDDIAAMNRARVMSYQARSSGAEIQGCIEACRAAGYTYAAGQWGVECWCGHDFYHVPSKNCTMRCERNAAEICGNAFVNSVYSVCEKGFYGTDCRSACSGCPGIGCHITTGQCFTDNCVDKCDSASEVCNNTPTRYYCTCRPGFDRTTVNGSCTDIDECKQASMSKCSVLCTNTAGSYYCSCHGGYRLRADKQTCEDINECVEGTHNCEHDCTNTVGSYACSCRTGYDLDINNNHKCPDKDECAKKGTGWSECEQKCVNTAGSYYCDCNAGYRLSANNRTCEDIDECDINVAPDWELYCEHNCTNTAGSYYCNCATGYALVDNGRCQLPGVAPCTTDALFVLTILFALAFGVSLIVNIILLVCYIRIQKKVKDPIKLKTNKPRLPSDSKSANNTYSTSGYVEATELKESNERPYQSLDRKQPPESDTYQSIVSRK